MSKYAIWNKKDAVLTPVGEVLTPEQWIERYPIAGVESIVVVCSAGEINGGFFGTLGSMVEQYEEDGADFSACTTPEEKIEVINAFDVARVQKQKEAYDNAVNNEELTATSLASIAASLEYQNMMTLDDVEVQ